MARSKSCLVARLSNYIDIDDRLENLLATLEKNEKPFDENTEVYHGGEQTQNLYVVKHGWFLSYTDLPDGSRLIVKLHHPGDILGFDGIAYKKHAISLKSCTAGHLCPFDKQDLDAIFETAPQLTALLFSLAVREQVITIDRLKVISRMSAKPRLAHFLLDLICRLRMTNPSMSDEFRLPLTQTEIGDAIGLTNVSVSRTFGRMEEAGLIKRTDTGIRLLNEAELIKSCDFEDRHSKIDTSWFPQSHSQ